LLSVSFFYSHSCVQFGMHYAFREVPKLCFSFNTQTDLSLSFGMILVRLQIIGAHLVLAYDAQQLKVITVTTTEEGMVSDVPINVRLQS